MISEEQILEIAARRGLAPIQVREEISRIYQEIADRYQGAAVVKDISFDVNDPTATLHVTVRPLSEATVGDMHLQTARLELAAVYGVPRTALSLLRVNGLK